MNAEKEVDLSSTIRTRTYVAKIFTANKLPHDQIISPARFSFLEGTYYNPFPLFLLDPSILEPEPLLSFPC